MVICIKQHLSKIWDSIHEKVKQDWGWVCVYIYIYIYVILCYIILWGTILWKNKVNAKQCLKTEFFLLKKYAHSSSTLSSKNKRMYSEE